MQDADALVPTLATDFDKALGGSLNPGRHHASFGVPYAAKALPISCIAPHYPILNDLANPQPIDHFLIHRSCSEMTQTSTRFLARWAAPARYRCFRPIARSH